MHFSDRGMPVNLRPSVRCPCGGGIQIEGGCCIEADLSDPTCGVV